jgi:hypothetical protein
MAREWLDLGRCKHPRAHLTQHKKTYGDSLCQVLLLYHRPLIPKKTTTK